MSTLFPIEPLSFSLSVLLSSHTTLFSFTRLIPLKTSRSSKPLRARSRSLAGHEIGLESSRLPLFFYADACAILAIASCCLRWWRRGGMSYGWMRPGKEGLCGCCYEEYGAVFESWWVESLAVGCMCVIGSMCGVWVVLVRSTRCRCVAFTCILRASQEQKRLHDGAWACVALRRLDR